MIQQSILSLLDDYRSKTQDPIKLLPSLLEAARADNNNCWISVTDDQQLNVYLAKLEGESPDSLPLFGVPFAVKDNIDLAGLATTAACPAFSYEPTESATVVQLLINAGAIPLGKTNMDQFATGLVGVRSPEPWGACKNSLNEAMISGGSSSGSAVALAKGYVCFSLGTDTAGSGRIPAAFNNLVGLKPSKGLLSTKGVVPACASLDCVSIFALNSEDANHVLNIAAQFDEQDPWSRKNPYSNGPRYFNPAIKTFTFAVPEENQLAFFGDASAQSEFKNACEALTEKGRIIITTESSVSLGGVNYAAITVEDNGPGISQEMQQQLFSPLKSTKGNHHSGLGLSIVNKLVTEMNGSIVCRSHTQSSTGSTGTQFQILLPK